MNRIDREDKYKQWWEGRHIRFVRGSVEEFRLAVSVRYEGPPSGTWGSVWICFEDGDVEARGE